MAASIVQQAEGAQDTALATVSATLTSPATAGNLILVVVGADAYIATPPSGFTESTGCKQQTNLGHYVWWKVAAGGETSVSYTIGSAATSVWEIYEIAGLTSSPYDISAGQFVASGASSYTTPAVTPTAGDRLLVAAIGGSMSGTNFTALGTWLNSFTALDSTMNTKASGTRDVIGAASLAVTADGLTAYSSGASYTPNATARTGIVIAFKVASGGSTVNGAASIAGAGSLSAAASVAVPGSATLTGAGSLTAAGKVVIPGSVALAGAGSVTAVGRAVVPASVSMTGTGSLSASVGATTTGSAALTAAGSLSATATVGRAGAASLAASGACTATARVLVPGAVSLVGAGALSAAGQGIVVASASLVGAGSMAAGGSVPGSVVIRPYTGTVSRPNAGVIVRP